MKILFTINLCLLIMSQLNTWLPITFGMFNRVRITYIFFVRLIIAVRFGYLYAREYRSYPEIEEFYNYLYGVDNMYYVRVSYRLNWLAFVFFSIVQAIIYFIWLA